MFPSHDQQVENAVRQAIEQRYGKTKFNNSLDVSDVVELIKQTDDSIVSPINISFQISQNQNLRTDQDVEFSFKNKIRRGGAGEGLSSSIFNSPKFGLSSVFIEDTGRPPNRFGFSPLRLVTRDSNGLVSVVSPSGVGEINYDTGQVKILKNVGSSFIRFDTNFAEPKADAKQEVVLKVLQGTVTVNQV